MNRERDIAKNSFIFTAGRISAQLAGFLLLPLYSALLTPEDYGTADLINTLVFLILAFIGIQLDTALFRYTVDARSNKNKQIELFSTVLIINLIQIAAYTAIYFAVRPFISLPYKDILLINVVLMILVNTFLQFMRGLGMNVKYSAAVFITSFTGVTINVILVAGFKWGVTGIIVGSAASQFLTLVYAIFALKPWRYFKAKSFSKDTSKTLFKYSFPLIPNQLAWWVMGISDRLVISGTIGVSANGIYSLSNKFSSIYTSVSDSINLSWMESTSLHYNEKDGKEYVSGMLNKLFVLFASACFAFIAVIPYAFLLINKNYSDSFMQIPILLLAVLCQAAVGLYSSVLIALKKTKSIAVTSIIAALINLAVDIVFVKQIGIYAGSISTLAAFAVLAVLRCFLVSKTFGIRPSFKIVLPVILWGAAVTFCYYLKNPVINAVALLITLIISVVINRKIIAMIFSFIKNKMFDIKHNKRKQMIYSRMKKFEDTKDVAFATDILGDSDLNELVTYKDESWNYIKDLRTYQKHLMKGEHPNWEDNICTSNKYVISNNIISVKTDATDNNWLCFYINKELPESYEFSYDICINSEFTEVQLAFNYKDLGNRYRFMIRDNKVCLFEAVYEGAFLDSFEEVPFSLSVGSTHRICVRVIDNVYEMYIDDVRILAVEETGARSVSGNRACIILWNETDSAPIDCTISNIKIRGL